MITRRAQLADLDKLNQLFNGYRVFYKKQPDLTASRAFLQERMENNESVIFVAEDEDGTLCGFTQLYPIFTSTNLKRVWLLNDLYVDANHRGRGISILLLDAAKDHCRATGAFGVTLETERTNDIGNALYPRAGFTHDVEHNFYYWQPES